MYDPFKRRKWSNLSTLSAHLHRIPVNVSAFCRNHARPTNSLAGQARLEKSKSAVRSPFHHLEIWFFTKLQGSPPTGQTHTPVTPVFFVAGWCLAVWYASNRWLVESVVTQRPSVAWYQVSRVCVHTWTTPRWSCHPWGLATWVQPVMWYLWCDAHDEPWKPSTACSQVSCGKVQRQRGQSGGNYSLMISASL